MSSALLVPYTGILEDIHVVRVGQILGLPVAERATAVVQGGTESYPFSVSLQRDEMFAAMRVFEDNVQVESRVLSILRAWDALPLADETGVAEKSRRRLREDLRAIYPVHVEDGSSGMRIAGR